jgi:hypothetical protein
VQTGVPENKVELVKEKSGFRSWHWVPVHQQDTKLWVGKQMLISLFRKA